MQYVGRGIGSFLRICAYVGKVTDMVESIDAESLPVSVLFLITLKPRDFVLLPSLVTLKSS